MLHAYLARSAGCSMVKTDDIEDPTWHDIFDRDREITRLEKQILILRAEVERERELRAAVTSVLSEEIDRLRSTK